MREKCSGIEGDEQRERERERERGSGKGGDEQRE